VSLRAILKAYERIRGEAGEAARKALFKNMQSFDSLAGDLGLSEHMVPARAAVRCFVVGGNSRVKELSGELRNAGYDVKPILSPTVPRGRECLRFSLHAFNTEVEIREVLSILAKALKAL
jgi:8-amino-7-oxononanoate synthase